jgi:prevent-host-death family protein
MPSFHAIRVCQIFAGDKLVIDRSIVWSLEMATKVPATAAKAKFSEILERIQKGESFLITLHGEETARLIPVRRRDHDEICAIIGRLKKNRVTLNPPGKPKLKLRSLISEGRL